MAIKYIGFEINRKSFLIIIAGCWRQQDHSNILAPMHSRQNQRSKSNGHPLESAKMALKNITKDSFLPNHSLFLTWLIIIIIILRVLFIIIIIV